jgi:catalase
MRPEEKQLLFNNTARAMKGASQQVLERHVANCAKADPAYGRGVAEALGISVREDELVPSK